jgi:hypothetical protein
VKSLLFGKNGEHAITKIRELESERQQMLSEFNSLLAYVNTYKASALSAQRKFMDLLTRESLDAWMVAESLLPGTKEAERLLSALANDRFAEQRFRTAHPECREVLRSACEHKLEAARAELDQVRATETKRLKPRGFDAESIEDDLSIRRGRRKVESLENLLAKINDDPDERVWQNANRLLQTA